MTLLTVTDRGNTCLTASQRRLRLSPSPVSVSGSPLRSTPKSVLLATQFHSFFFFYINNIDQNVINISATLPGGGTEKPFELSRKLSAGLGHKGSFLSEHAVRFPGGSGRSQSSSMGLLSSGPSSASSSSPATIRLFKRLPRMEAQDKERKTSGGNAHRPSERPLTRPLPAQAELHHQGMDRGEAPGQKHKPPHLGA